MHMIADAELESEAVLETFNFKKDIFDMAMVELFKSRHALPNVAYLLYIFLLFYL